jgi:cytochrome c peroxidase
MRELLVLLLAVAPAALAGTPADLLGDYEAQARRESAAFAGSSAERGGELYRGSAGASASGAASCASCHSPDPLLSGRHARTGKAIAPLAPAANPDRFTDAAKAEKWFGRNCRDVLGRECTAREKADFVRYLTDAK